MAFMAAKSQGKMLWRRTTRKHRTKLYRAGSWAERVRQSPSEVSPACVDYTAKRRTVGAVTNVSPKERKQKIDTSVALLRGLSLKIDQPGLRAFCAGRG